MLRPGPLNLSHLDRKSECVGGGVNKRHGMSECNKISTKIKKKNKQTKKTDNIRGKNVLQCNLINDDQLFLYIKCLDLILTIVPLKLPDDKMCDFIFFKCT